MSKYKKMFVDEAREHLALAAQHLVDLEKAPQDSALINELFRNAHSIKGMAASLGYEEISDLTHILEDLLDLYRCEKRILNAQAIDTLLRAIDFTERMVNEVDADTPLSDPAGVVREIRQIMAGAAPADLSHEPATEVQPGPAKDPAPGHDEPGEKQQRPGCLRIIFRVAPDSVSPGARGFLGIRKLSTLGTVKRLRPEMEAIKAGRYGRVVEADLETDHGPDEVTQALAGVPEIIDVRIESAATGSTLVGPEETRTPSAARTPGTRNRGQSTTVRVKTEALDRFVDAVGEIILNKSELREIARDLDSEALLQGLSRLEVSLEELKRQAMNVRLTPIERALAPLPRLVRDVARSHNKEVRLEIRGAELELDRSLVDALNEPLIHLVRNALDHGLETPHERTAAGKSREGRILIEAYREKDIAVIHVEDDGRGVDVAKVREGAVSRGFLSAEEAESTGEEAILNLLFAPGMSTAAEVSEISGRGVGLDAVKAGVQGLGGSVGLRSRAGGGAQFTLRIPFSASILRALIVRIGEDIFAVPIPKLHRAFEAGPEDLLEGARGDASGRFCRFEKALLPARSLAGLLGLNKSGDPGLGRRETRPVIVADTRSGRTALLVDDLVGEEEVFVKPLGRPLAALESLSGITVLGNGRPVFVLDPYGLEAAIPSEECEGDSADKECDA